MKNKIVNGLYVILSACIVVPLYILCHEGGHALVALLGGAEITSFHIIGAYVGSEGGSFNTITSGLFLASGMLLPVLLSLSYMLLYKKASENRGYRIFSCMLTMAFSAPTAAWIVVPVLYLLNRAPAGDDVTKFLDVTGMHPIVLIALSVTLLIVNIMLAWYKNIIQNYWNELQKTDV